MIANSLIDVQPLIDVISLTLQTAFVCDDIDGYRPASLLLIARPESGKTTAIKEFRELKYVRYYNEITVKTLVNEILPLVQSGEVRFIVSPDLLNWVEKQTYTRKPLLNTLKSLVDEGIREIKTPHKRYTYSKDIKAGLIGAITRKSLGIYRDEPIKNMIQPRYSLYSDLRRMGFLTRMIPFSYQYPIDKIVEIFRYIEGASVPEDKKVAIPKIKVRKRPVKYEPNPEYFPDLRIVSKELGSICDGSEFLELRRTFKSCVTVML